LTPGHGNTWKHDVGGRWLSIAWRICLATAQRPHFTDRLERADALELGKLLAALGPARPGERRIEMYRVDITADLNDQDHTGYLWTFLDEARDPAQISPGALVVAGDEDAAAVCLVIDLVPAGDGTIVHLRPLPGSRDGLAQCRLGASDN
jgi:hypothetical protein